MISFLFPDEINLFEAYVIQNGIPDSRIWIDGRHARIKTDDE